ncbi:cytochrome d ubiquinol oxidase subunit II [Actinophytocola algeriensis]|uniref:Cytochrome d ubiquinol oxidase subunit II n=1 Tax=Actinophytocola algeriensis TaxID=1768010 RepID=A0A7W7Q4F0_9PSEU|nr:cytochrome d ubiquinol oxidase subunit II [Actinophytocola algeriensis]MBB4906860.1 cytochrome d ubiquinol oxidase subunit II [Actinophytocola algeriensis]MBE1478341.1 cytochrome d ubiquinol oxidase subunit II [Actinophytocola algeriensis]
METFWFVAIAALWFGYLFLEGFDFGVGMLLRLLGRSERDRRAMLTTIGPVWDGNEVWLIVAAGATFAAFPGWYAGLFSAGYLPMLLLLLALIGRGVALEWRGKVDTDRWRSVWDTVITGGSLVATLCVGLVLSWNVLGLPLDANGNRVGSPFAALRWDTALGALAVTGFALVHGAVFVALKTEGPLRHRARRFALSFLPVGLAPVMLLAVVAQLRSGAEWTWLVVFAVLVAAVCAWVCLEARREGRAFALLGVVLSAAVLALFGALYPNVLPSTVDPAYSLSIADTASSPYTLTVMTWVAGFGAPAVLVYQGWTYWVFRKRVLTS